MLIDQIEYMINASEILYPESKRKACKKAKVKIAEKVKVRNRAIIMHRDISPVWIAALTCKVCGSHDNIIDCLCKDCYRAEFDKAYRAPYKAPKINKPSNKRYCYKFDEQCREMNRFKHGNVCWLCGKTVSENKGRKLSVHHIDLNKDQGCDGHEWRLIPLCAVCHGMAHSELMRARIEYMYQSV